MNTNDSYMDETATSKSTGLSHTLDIIKAAFPYLDSESQQSLNLVIKTGELFETFHSIKEEGSVTTLSVRKQSIDIEALLNGIRDVCNQKEKALVDMILNFYKAKNLYNTYSTLASVMASQNENTDQGDNHNNSNQSDNIGGLGSLFGMGGNMDMSEMMELLLTPEQKSTFDNLNMMLNVM